MEIGEIISAQQGTETVKAMEATAEEVEKQNFNQEVAQKFDVGAVAAVIEKELPALLQAEQQAEAALAQEAGKDKFFVWGHYVGQEREFALLKITYQPTYFVGDFACSGTVHQTMACRQVRLSSSDYGRMTFNEDRKWIGHNPAEGNLRLHGTFHLKQVADELVVQLQNKDTRSWNWIIKQSRREYFSRRRERNASSPARG